MLTLEDNTSYYLIACCSSYMKYLPRIFIIILFIFTLNSPNLFQDKTQSLKQVQDDNTLTQIQIKR
jgi:hypothetical protein